MLAQIESNRGRGEAMKSSAVVFRQLSRPAARAGFGCLVSCLVLGAGIGSASAAGGGGSSSGAFLAALPKITTVSSTVPANGDQNPYGIALVPKSVGLLHAGDLLISNFNAKSNNQGTGTTIDEITPGGHLSLFATVDRNSLPGACPGGVGLTTALAALPDGYVVVGSLPTTNGQSATAKLGCLIVLDSGGHAVKTIAGPQVAGPWDLTAVTHGSVTTLFVSMVLNGGAAKGIHTADTSTVVRIRLNTAPGTTPAVLDQQVIANGIPWRDDKNALVIGPTGVALAPDGTLYLADTLVNQITAIPDAMTRTTAAKGGGLTVSKGGAGSRSHSTATSWPPTQVMGTWSR
jgi:hypothetical protein